jgi:hypothetical protein
MEALQGFTTEYWPCSFVNRNGRCSLVSAGHSVKGHQRVDGRILAPGEYQPDFDRDRVLQGWYDSLVRNIGDLQRKLESKRLQQSQEAPYDDEDEEAAVVEIHSQQTRDFFDKIGNVSQFISHLACFSCLRELPEHPLPCGHVLCTPCVEAYGKRSGKSTMTIESCPLHSSATRWITPWEINIKPEYAGVRILSLDG